MTANNALDRIRRDTPLKSVRNVWQYEKELEVLQDYIDQKEKLLKAIKSMLTLEDLNMKVILQWDKENTPE